MQIITKCFSNGREVDLEATIQASIAESDAPFTTDELADAIIAANPQDAFMQDIDFVHAQVRRLVARIFSNPLCPDASRYLCDALPDGRYVRHGVQVQEEPIMAAPVVESTQESHEEEMAPYYEVYVQYTAGRSYKYQGFEKAASDAALARIEAENARIAAKPRVRGWAPPLQECHVEVSERPVNRPDPMPDAWDSLDSETKSFLSR